VKKEEKEGNGTLELISLNALENAENPSCVSLCLCVHVPKVCKKESLGSKDPLVFVSVCTCTQSIQPWQTDPNGPA